MVLFVSSASPGRDVYLVGLKNFAYLLQLAIAFKTGNFVLNWPQVQSLGKMGTLLMVPFPPAWLMFCSCCCNCCACCFAACNVTYACCNWALHCTALF